MKTLILLVFGLCTMSGFYIKAFGKDPVNIKAKSDTIMVEQQFVLPGPGSLRAEIFPVKDEIVINREMVNRFCDNYNYTDEVQPSVISVFSSKTDGSINNKTNGPVNLLPENLTKDIVINMEMINSFRRCYDRIEVIPWGELLSSTPGRDWGIVYTAYRRLSYQVSVNNAVNIIASLKQEMAKVKEEFKTIPDSLCMLTNPNFRVVKPGRIVITKNRE